MEMHFVMEYFNKTFLLVASQFTFFEKQKKKLKK